MLGVKGDMSVPGGKFRKLFDTPRIEKSLAQIDVYDELDLAANFLLDEQGLKKYVQQAAIMTDDNPIIEYRPPGINAAYKDTLWEMLKYRLPVSRIAELLGIDEGDVQRLGQRMRKLESVRMSARLYEQEP